MDFVSPIEKRAPSCSSTEPTTRNSCVRSTVTVLMCDIVSSTRISTSLPVETFRNLILDYYQICEEFVHQRNGIIVQYNGDGILSVFGDPFVGDGSTLDAVNAGLSISQHQYSHHGCPYEIRVAACTGEIATGTQTGCSPVSRDTIFGTAPYLASRLQSVASPGSLIVDKNTFEKVNSQFDARWLGLQNLRGFDQLQPAWQVKLG